MEKVEVELKVFNSGWVPAHKSMVITGGRGKIRMPALFAMIRHPRQGVILYDTGYSTRFYEATSKLPYRLMRIFTPAEIREEDNADRQLLAAGVSPDEVRTIILGHGHADHSPGIVYFPNAEVVVESREWEAMQGSALKLFLNAYVKSLYEGIGNKIRLVDLEKQGKPCQGFDRGLDLFDDGSMILVSLPGHTAGQMGLLVNAASGKFFFIGDAAWITDNYLTLCPPARPARLIIHSFKNFMNSLRKVQEFNRKFPEVIIVPSHCPSAWERVKGKP